MKQGVLGRVVDVVRPLPIEPESLQHRVAFRTLLDIRGHLPANRPTADLVVPIPDSRIEPKVNLRCDARGGQECLVFLDLLNHELLHTNMESLWTAETSRQSQ